MPDEPKQSVLNPLHFAYLRGISDRKHSVKVGDNPYPESEETFWHWMNGWTDAAMEEIKGVENVSCI